ncbi:hypothetical protein PR202_ga06847 [Eleusine coracana subsp. coracana]|uniref:Uncharacterized protein n=1 Tax=Eleusine coracana subsp. coracana TaxID=191504 RepID=A0AAV5BW17_ELECO|nr:hypothetical protein PR202_ga06847 [Eleusine coracana subsp. coracana]
MSVPVSDFQASTAARFTQTLSFDGCSVCQLSQIVHGFSPLYTLAVLHIKRTGITVHSHHQGRLCARQMAGLQRSAQTFRRSGSSGLVWDERFLTEGAEEKKPNDTVHQPELRHSRSVGSAGMLWRRRRDDAVGDVDDKKRKLVVKPKAQKDQQNRERKEAAAPGRKAFRTRDVAPAAEPPSPRVSGCVLCSIFRSTVRGQWRGSSAQRARPRKR